jgi:hypothetical protein
MTNNKVSRKEMYDELKEVRADIGDVKIMLTEYHGDVKHNKEDIQDLKKRSNIIDGITGAVGILAVYLGVKN